MKDLSIVVPVYNVERYIKPCIESIYKQGLSDDVFELIIVNDGTPDNSMNAISDFIASHANVIVVNQQNQGLSAARNAGIAIASGVYVALIDPDDLLVPDSLSPLLSKALETGVDMLVADFIEMNDEGISHLCDNSIVQPELSFLEMSGDDMFLKGLKVSECEVWRTLYKRTFLKDHRLMFVPGLYYEDLPFTHECCFNAKRCLRTHWKLYVYRKHRASITGSYNAEKIRQNCNAVKITWELHKKYPLKPKISDALERNMRQILSQIVFVVSKYIDSYQERRKTIPYIRQTMFLLPEGSSAKWRRLRFVIKWLPQTYLTIRRIYGIVIEDNLHPFIRRHLFPFFSNR